MQDQLNTLERKLDQVIDILKGDDFGRDGLVAKQQNNRKRISQLEDDHKKIKWLGSVGVSLWAAIVLFKDEILRLFGK